MGPPSLTPHTRSDLRFTHTPIPPATPFLPFDLVFGLCGGCEPGLQKTEDYRKASDPDGVLPVSLKAFTKQLAPIFSNS